MASPENTESVSDREPSNVDWTCDDGSPAIPPSAPHPDRPTESGQSQPAFVAMGGGLVALGLVLWTAQRPLPRTNRKRLTQGRRLA
jgi:hypothetical protein